jgi:branched-chain amino acid transport system substrate-binding protein
VQAIKRAKSLDSERVAEAMHSGMTFDTVLGKCSFDKQGDRNAAICDVRL